MKPEKFTVSRCSEKRPVTKDNFRVFCGEASSQNNFGVLCGEVSSQNRFRVHCGEVSIKPEQL